MGIHTSLIRLLQTRQSQARLRRRGAIGDFYRAGGDALLHDLPLAADDIVVDAGGYLGDWTAAIMVRYGCRSELFEPIPEFIDRCNERFGANTRIAVRAEALGGSTRTARFSIDSVASSEFRGTDGSAITAAVTDIHGVVEELAARHGDVGCLKLNIEGGEYEALERLLDTGSIARCRSVLVQFHAQPEGWQARLDRIARGLEATHAPAWRYPMIWEKWIRRTKA